jgi:hypothetical protein
VAAVVEVHADGPAGSPETLVGAAYRASREGTVVLVLNGVSASQVDRALDAVVPRVADVAGVAYCTPSTLERVLDDSGWPAVAFVETGSIAAPLAERGVHVLPRGLALRALAALDQWRTAARGKGEAEH